MAAEHRTYSQKWLNARLSGARIDQKTNMAIEACQIFNSLLSSAAAIAIGVGSLLIGWFTYTFLCDSPLGKKPGLLGLVIFALLVFAAWALSQVFSGRGAFIHVGAIIGTIMVGNVFRVIMPAQRALLKAVAEGREPDPALPAKGLLRSRHNNYFTLPVLFIMISNHFPSTFGAEFNWAVLAALSALSVLVRHYFNTRHATQQFAWALPAAALGMVTLAFVLAPQNNSRAAAQEVSFHQVSQVIEQRCTVCHSSSPSFAGFNSAPAGITFDSAEQIKRLSPRIHAQSIATQAMPLGNVTQMTQEERDLLGRWIASSASID